jgi:hypothetical protein
VTFEQSQLEKHGFHRARQYGMVYSLARKFIKIMKAASRNSAIFFILLLLMLNLCAGCQKKVKAPVVPEPLAEKSAASGCSACHEPLRTALPEGHRPIENDSLPSCLSCHSELSAKGGRSFDLTIHSAHYSAEAFRDNCWACHRMNENGQFELSGVEGMKGIKVEKPLVEKMAPYFRSGASSKYLDHIHSGYDVGCASCHEKPFPDSRASMDQCLNCHVSYEHVAKLTEAVKPNPHRSHYEDLRCTICHKAHEPSVLYCNQCHKFDLNVP